MPAECGPPPMQFARLDGRAVVGQRVFAIALGYEDLIDHDALRHDPVPGMVLGRLEARRSDCAPLAG